MNKYYDDKDCGIGRHGDAEGKIVVCARLVYSFPLLYQWYKGFKIASSEVRITLDHGDLYFMSEKAVGED